MWQQPPDLQRDSSGGNHLAAQLHAVEKHLRKNPIGGATFAQARTLRRSMSKHFAWQGFRCAHSFTVKWSARLTQI